MLKPQYLNLAASSFQLWLENFILRNGSGLSTGVSTRFYPIGQVYNNLYAYSAPYQPQVADSSISAPMTGIYVNNVFCQRGISGFVDINYKKNQIYFNTNQNSQVISGTYPLADIQVLPLNISEEKLLFETKFNTRPKTTQTLSGINSDSYTYPSIYVKGFSASNSPYAFGGQDLTEVNIGLMMCMESAYQVDALKSILCDAKLELVPLITADKFPYNIYGGFKETGSNFNYDILRTGYLYPGNSGMYIKDVVVSSFKREYNLDASKLNPDIHWAICDITLCKNRFPRNTNNL